MALELVDDWVAVLTEGASDLVSTETIAEEAASVAGHFEDAGDA